MDYIVFVRTGKEDELLRSFQYSHLNPMPGIGYIIWIAEIAYKVLEVHIGYDKPEVVIIVERN